MMNCIKCSRWRANSDFAVRVSKNLSKKTGRIKESESVSKVCDSCSRANQRRYNKAHRERYGLIVRGTSLDPIPLLNHAKAQGMNWTQISRAAGVDVRRVYDWRKGVYCMPFYTADKLCTNLGLHINLVYDE